MGTNSTKKVSRLLTDMREDGIIPWEWIVDDSRSLDREPGFANLEEYGEAIARSFRRDFWADQSSRIIVVSEKATVSGLLRPVIQAYGVSWFPVHGFNSATKITEVVEGMKVGISVSTSSCTAATGIRRGCGCRKETGLPPEATSAIHTRRRTTASSLWSGPGPDDMVKDRANYGRPEWSALVRC